MYHKADESHSDFLTVTVAQLKRQLKYIASNYKVISLSDLLEHIEIGKQLPEKALLITFDDAYANNYSLAWPLFREMQIPFAIFTVSGFVDRTLQYDGHVQAFLGSAQISEMNGLCEFALHGFEHANLMNLNEDEWEKEIEHCIEKAKEKNLPFKAAWAYTYGSFPKHSHAQFELLKTIFRKNGIKCAFRIGNRLNNLPLKDNFCIQRLDIRGKQSFLRFCLKLKYGKPF